MVTRIPIICASGAHSAHVNKLLDDKGVSNFTAQDGIKQFCFYLKIIIANMVKDLYPKTVLKHANLSPAKVRKFVIAIQSLSLPYKVCHCHTNLVMPTFVIARFVIAIQFLTRVLDCLNQLYVHMTRLKIFW